MMNSEDKERAKKLKDIIQAALDGKIIEVRYIGPNDNISKEWYIPISDSSNIMELLERFEPKYYEYRIAPDPQYIPYDNSSEVFEYLKNNPEVVLREKGMSVSFGVAMVPNRNNMVLLFRDGNCFYKTLSTIFRDYKWSNGELCGKTVI